VTSPGDRALAHVRGLAAAGGPADLFDRVRITVSFRGSGRSVQGIAPEMIFSGGAAVTV